MFRGVLGRRCKTSSRKWKRGRGSQSAIIMRTQIDIKLSRLIDSARLSAEFLVLCQTEVSPCRLVKAGTGNPQW